MNKPKIKRMVLKRKTGSSNIIRTPEDLRYGSPLIAERGSTRRAAATGSCVTLPLFHYGTQTGETEKLARPARRCTSRQRPQPCQRLPQVFYTLLQTDVIAGNRWSQAAGYAVRYFRPTLYLLPEEYYTPKETSKMEDRVLSTYVHLDHRPTLLLCWPTPDLWCN